MKKYIDYLNPNITIQSLVKSYASITPEKVALIDGNIRLTYKELDHVTDCLALDLLSEYSISSESIIGAYFQKSYKYIIAALGILKTGATILHIDEDYPLDTLSYIIKETNPLTILTCEELSDIISRFSSCKIISKTKEVKCFNLGKININVDHSKTAIIGYTSGTTGRPKGVEVSHRACIYSFNKFWEEIDHINNKDNFGYVTYLAWDAFSPLVHGRTGIFIPTEANEDMSLLSETLMLNDVNNLFFTPSLLDKLLCSLSTAQLKRTFENINVVWVGGEIIKKSTIQNLYKVKPQIILINNYGPSECFVVSQGLIDYQSIKNETIVNAGFILPELDYILLNEYKDDVTHNGVGYLLITGPALANQYFGNEKLTKNKFIKMKDRIYYDTGDYCKVDKDRKITILGRNSFILKNGQSLTPVSFLENKILGDENIDNCVVITTEESQAFIFVVSKHGFSRNVIEEIIGKYVDFFKVIEVGEIPIKPASQKINYEELIKLV